ncbi:MAG: hypothetical protein BZY80_07075 [SAR202 cluster bacterium Io17-Chloro-G2]|nr:MAG: hypothetical protein BZY80_07075 [SAR202 cluster bacterium Io17-Chloro-G2]
MNTDTSNSKMWVLLAVCVPLFCGVLNASAVGVVLPAIVADLDVAPGQLPWLMTGFLLVYGIAIPFYGRLADLHGARRLFLLGVAVFSLGSLFAALAPSFAWLLAARVIQAIGGAAVPSLGMTLASRAYGQSARGTVLGIIAATIGAGAAIGPLVGGILSETLGWQAIFVFTALAALAVPFGLKVLPRDEELTRGRLDIPGGVALALLVAGALLVPTEGARAGWTSPLAIVGASMAAAGLAILIFRQLTADHPFIPTEFLRNGRYVILVCISFFAMAANLAPLIGLPIFLALAYRLPPLDIGLVLLPGAVASSVFGIIAGRITDRKDPRLPIWAGSPLMLLGVVGLSAYAGSPVWVIAVFTGILGAGFGLMNTPLAATISRIVSGPMLASALSINSMLFFLGGSFGTAALMAVVNSRTAGSSQPLNPLHSSFQAGSTVAFSDAFLILAAPVILAMGLSLSMAKSRGPAAIEAPAPQEPAPIIQWVPDCSVPWMPECSETAVQEPEKVPAAAGAG